jgi:uncharacterized membrane protein
VKKPIPLILILIVLTAVAVPTAASFFGNRFKAVSFQDGFIKIPVASVDDGRAHFFKVMSQNNIEVDFFVLKSKDGILRAAVDACDVCYRAGKGYFQKGDYMVCANCGQKFLSTRINVVKGGCNPAPLERKVAGDMLLIDMQEINRNSWYCEFKR